MLRLPALGFATLLTACAAAGHTPISSPRPSPSSLIQPTATPTTSPVQPVTKPAFAVMEKDFLVEGGPLSTISIIGIDGRTVASVTAHKRAVPGVQIGNIATSATRVYYLDGDADVRFLKPDGTSGTATRIRLGPHQTAAIAVTPDDRRIAVSILDF